MNRPGAVPQSLRGIPAGFGGQQQPQQQGRMVSNRLPNGGKLATNGSGWAFGGGVPMAGAGLPAPRTQIGSNVSFAQSLSGSTPATPLDLSEFPSLSNTQQLSTTSQSSMWGSGSSRSLGAPLPRNQATPLSAQQDDPFASSSRLGSQSSFRFSNQSGVSQGAQAQAGTADDFPPLGRNAGGEGGQDRGGALLSSLGFGAQTAPSTSIQANRTTSNGLLNALSANARSSETRPPPGVGAPGSSRVAEARGTSADEENRGKVPFREESLSLSSSVVDGPGQGVEARSSLGAIGNDTLPSKNKDDKDGNPEPQDPLAGMSDSDKWGFKGLLHLMNNYPDYAALMTGIDPNTLGFDLTSNEPFSTQIYSPFDDTPPRLAIPKYKMPECYTVTNIQPIETKIGSFNEETLFWIFYSSPQDVKQQLAAVELHSRNWRWHKKLQIWLTKDDLMVPHVLSPTHERGYYIIWDTALWRKDRREITLHYSDLDTTLGQQLGS